MSFLFFSLVSSEKSRQQANYEAGENYLCEPDTISIDKIYLLERSCHYN